MVKLLRIGVGAVDSACDLKWEIAHAGNVKDDAPAVGTSRAISGHTGDPCTVAVLKEW
ncbi:hypothetical protein [Pigmentiphaga litoralis]|uniref:Uncharacterized protein n=1 Tax=Pigmentiphaga litoralis TaxID=516702 RepID=A0A7Y9LLB5_9BURK|nr:hypothetical protein [Pigmentiphaga litoralis]NYE22611.1 hypothetical protein [Pigmentiphaga litoralis]NYE83774.1 hypothetical protein [Pigmentiphaga litoralis]